MTAALGTQAIPAFLNALDYARAGMQRGVSAYEQVAAQLTRAVAHPASLSARNEAAALDARDQVVASARVFETGNQLLGTILDLRA